MIQILRISAYIAVAAVTIYLLFGPDGFDPQSLRGKGVLVTGASTGLGEHLAMEYAKLGVRLVITARREQLLLKLAERCREMGALEVHIVVADMAKEADRARLVDVVREKLKDSLDVLLLNHAMMENNGPWSGTAESMAQLRLRMEVNFISVVDVASRCRTLLEATKGKIGVVSSILGKMGSYVTQTYSSSKFALHGFFQSWRQELNLGKTGISITMCVLCSISTDHFLEIMETEYPQLPNIWKIINASPTKTATAILRAVDTRRYEMMYGWFAQFLVTSYWLAPEFVEGISTFILTQLF